MTHEAHKLLSLEVSLKGERLRSVEDTLATERTRQGRERDAVQLLRSQNKALADTLQSHVADLAKERSRAETALMKLAQREESAQTQLEELRQAGIRNRHVTVM